MKHLGVFLFIILGCFAANPLQARDYLKAERAQSRGFTPGVVTEGGKIVWISGQTGLVDEQGKSMAGDFEGVCGRIRTGERRAGAMIGPAAASRRLALGALWQITLRPSSASAPARGERLPT